MTTSNMGIETRDGLAAGYMLMAVASLSLIPLVVSWSGGSENPFLFNAGWRAGVALGCTIFISVFYAAQIRSKAFWRLTKRRIFDVAILLSMVGNFEYALFTWATRFLDISIVAILYAVWPIFVILLMSRLFSEEPISEEPRYRKITYTTMLLLFVGLVGYAFVVSSQVGEFLGRGTATGAESANIFWGVLLSIIAAIATSFAGFSFKWGSKASRELSVITNQSTGNTSYDLLFLVVAYLIANSISVPINMFGGLISGQGMNISTFAIGVLGGASVQTTGSILWRKANFATNNLGINALVYATPIFSLGWLLLFSQINVPRVDFLLIGTAAIITANLLINFEVQVRFGFKALILGLWACGTFVYLRDDILLLLPFGGWLWPRETYLGALGLSATVFILLLTFRVARLAPRTQDEDNRIFALHRNLELLARRGLIAYEVSGYIRDIDGAKTPNDLARAYVRAKRCFAKAAVRDNSMPDAKLLADAEAGLNMVVHSRQQGIDLGEVFSLIIFGGVTVALALLSRPAVNGWVGFLIEVFSTLFPAVAVFLIVSVWDLHRDRAADVLKSQQIGQEYGVFFQDTRNRRFERSVSMVVGLLIILVYAGLLWYKWL